MRSPRRWLLAAIVALAAGNLWSTFHRSGIPVGWKGTVQRVELRREKHPGVDDVYLVTVEGQRTHLDAHLAQRLFPGEEIEKAPWSRALSTPRGLEPLEVSEELWRMAVAMPLLLLLALGLSWRQGRGP